MTKTKPPTGSTRPHRARHSALQLDLTFELHKGLERVRTVHAHYVDGAIGLLRVAHRLEAMSEYQGASAVEGLVVLLEQQAKRHLEDIAKRHAGNGGEHG